jgi:hypothetical protein
MHLLTALPFFPENQELEVCRISFLPGPTSETADDSYLSAVQIDSSHETWKKNVLLVKYQPCILFFS